MNTYLVAGVGVLIAILILYILCLKLSENDWTVEERTPPGPAHLPLLGSLVSVLRGGSLVSWVDGLLATQGPVARVSLPGRRLVLATHTKELEALAAQGSIEELTVGHYALVLLERLGSSLTMTEELLEEYTQLADRLYHYTVSMAEFTILMESADNYRCALHESKMRAVVSWVLRREVTLDISEKLLISRGFQQMEKLKDDLARSSPAIWLPLTPPHVYLERKRLSKSLKKIRENLTQVFHKCGGEDPSRFSLFFVLTVLMGLAETNPKKTQLRKLSDTATPSTSQQYQPAFDILGFRFFHTLDYVSLGKFDIPGKTLIVSSSRNASNIQ